MDEFVPMLALLALVKKLVDFSKYVTNKDLNGALTQIWSWLVGIAVVWVFSETSWADQIVVGGVSLAGASFAVIVVVGLTVGSAGSVLTDVVKGIDGSDSAAMPKLLPGAQDGPAPG